MFGKGYRKHKDFFHWRPDVLCSFAAVAHGASQDVAFFVVDHVLILVDVDHFAQLTLSENGSNIFAEVRVEHHTHGLCENVKKTNQGLNERHRFASNH